MRFRQSAVSNQGVTTDEPGQVPVPVAKARVATQACSDCQEITSTTSAVRLYYVLGMTQSSREPRSDLLTLSVVIPTLNEEQNIQAAVNRYLMGTQAPACQPLRQSDVLLLPPRASTD